MIHEQAKKIALRSGHEPVKNLSVFADVKMGQDVDRLTRRRELVVTRKRNENFVAHAADVDDRLGGQGRGKGAIEEGDHAEWLNVEA